VASLIAKTPCDGLLPLTAGSVSLTEAAPEAITSIAPLKGREKDAAAALKKAHALAFPGPGRATGKAGCRAVWSGQGQAFLLGPVADEALGETCALTDQSDGWAVMRLEGAGAEAVLARLCPLDLRAGVFRRGHTARSLIGHMNGVITRVGPLAFELMIFRSMAHTGVHELGIAMKSVAARKA